MAAGVAPVDVVDAPGLVAPVALAAKVSDIWNWTGKGQPPAPGDEVVTAGAAVVAPELPSEAELSETSLTPETRRSCTMVSATVDSSCAHPARTTAEGIAVELVVEPAVDGVADDADGAVACSELSAAFAGMSPPIWLSSCDQGKRPSARARTLASWAVRCWAVSFSEAKLFAAACQLDTLAVTLASSLLRPVTLLTAET